LGQVIAKAGTDDVEKVIDAWEDSSYDGLEGPFFIRKCDHQAVQLGFAVEAVKDPKYPHPIPKILATYPGEKVTPKCRTEDFSERTGRGAPRGKSGRTAPQRADARGAPLPRLRRSLAGLRYPARGQLRARRLLHAGRLSRLHHGHAVRLVLASAPDRAAR